MDDTVPEENHQDLGPQFTQSINQLVISFVQRYGWFILIGAIVAYYIWNRIQPKLQQMKDSREERDLKKYDVNTAQKRLESMDKSRERLQEQFDAQARIHAEEQKKRDEEKRKEKIEDWDRHLEGRGYRNKYRPAEETPSTSSVKPVKPQKKTPLRPTDFNPLMGAGGGSYRPPTRRTGGG